MDIAIGSYSFHGLLRAGKQDMFQYIADCKSLGCTKLDPWNAHLAPIFAADKQLKAAAGTASGKLSADEVAYVKKVREAADAAGLPFGCIAVDGAHIYEATEEGRAKNRAVAYRWLEASHLLGASQVRIDAGGPPEMPAEVFAVIAEGYGDLIRRGHDLKLEIVTENHWGPSNIPKNVVKLCENIPGLGLLFDSFNWAFGTQTEGWLTCARFARATHLKSFAFTEDGEELTENLPACIKLLKKQGYNGCWGVESCPLDGQEIDAARKTIALIRKFAG